MKIRCKYCDSYIDEELSACPNCGGVNADVKRSANGVPTTIGELKAYCESQGMPLEKMRFFIGQDYKGPRAFGIYRDDSGYEPVFVVYKNKDNGQRAIRYSGSDEAYAVNEIYQKLREETLRQAAAGNIKPRDGKPSNLHYGNRNQSYDWNRAGGRGTYPQRITGGGKRKSTGATLVTVFAVFIIVFALSIILGAFLASSSYDVHSGQYYYINDGYYYQKGNSKWYEYNPGRGSWERVDEEILPDDYYDYESTYEDFTDDYGASSAYGYHESSGSGGSWDDDNSWDSGSSWDNDNSWDSDWDFGGWDSDSSDWGSDW